MKQRGIVKVFVASPNDVRQERELLEEVVKELNDTWSDTIGVYLELVKWETHTYPELGSDAQSVINKQIGDEYDVFIGILWSRFGTPTPRSESGTVEEFERAYSKYKSNPDSIKVMFYFKDKALPPSKLDPEQISKINAFKNKLGELGSLHWSFEGTEEFAKYLRMHLSRQIQYWKDRPSSSEGFRVDVPIESSHIPEKIVENKIEEEEGFLDLVESGTESFEMLAEVANRMTDQLTNLSKYMEDNTNEMQSVDLSQGKEEVKKAKRIVNQMAQQLEVFSKRMEAEVPLYRKYFSTGIDSFGKAATLLTDFDSDIAKEIREALTTVEAIKSSTVQTRDAMNPFREIIATLPRATTKFNRAKRNCLTTLDALDKEMESSINLTDEVENTIKSILTNVEK